jgi:hypothetical protein
MLGEHPDVLGLFEFFTGLDWARRFDTRPMTGADFAALVGAEQPFVTAVMRRGYEVEEITYPFGGAGRFRRSDPLPWTLVSMLPRVSDDPDRLYDEMIEFARALPTQPPIAHYRALFAWLGERAGRRQWVERSGSSIEYLGELERLFDDARFVHLHRDGPETALSMREHHAYRLPICFLYDAPIDGATRVSDLGEIDIHAPASGHDPISRILAARPPAEYFGRYWCDQIIKGADGAAAIPPRRLLNVRFEDLLADPKDTVRGIAAFFELEHGDEGWVNRAAALVRGAVALRAPGLGPDERAALDAACARAMARLGRTPA